MIDLDFKYKDLTEYILKNKPFNPEIALILGSGLGNFADNLQVAKSISTLEIPNYPVSTVQGHKGFLHFAEVSGKKMLIFQGRIHFYEGYSIDKCIIPAFICEKLKVAKLLITNAAGGINRNFKPGDLMLVTDFLSQNIKLELSSILGIPSPDQKIGMQNIPSKSINEIIRRASLEENIFLQEGSYWFGKGPSYETPAEIRMQRFFGADAVGMSTVHETIYAGFHGIEVASISLITNYAAGLSPLKLSHQEVIETAEIAKEKIERLVNNIITKL